MAFSAMNIPLAQQNATSKDSMLVLGPAVRTVLPADVKIGKELDFDESDELQC